MRIADLEIAVPDDWEDHSLYTYVAPAEDVSPALSKGSSPFRTNVVFQQRPLGDETIEDRVQQVLKSTAETFGEVEVKVEDGPSNADMTSRRVSYTVVDGVTNQPVGQLIYVCVVGELEWQVAFSIAAISMRERIPDFDRMVASMQRAPR